MAIEAEPHQKETVTISLDGREVEARPGEMIIAAAEREGTYIPRFCYHPRMKPVGMCRMCLVQVKGPRGFSLQPACFVPVAEGQEIVTESPEVKKAQDGILEFLLVNHPLDCPVCDKGGECPLQDQAFIFGPGETRFVEEKRHWEKPISLSELVLLDRERCIQCARCTRFAEEIAGDPLIDFVNRGDRIEVNTFPDAPFSSYFSGNTVQICPVGALTSAPYRFRARPWDLEQVESSCTSCAVGCRVAIQSSGDRITRLIGIDADAVNQSWLCDKGRYNFDFINAERRLTVPLVRKNGELVETGWGEALDLVAKQLRQIGDQHGPAGLAFVGGARLANEDAYAWVRLAKGVLGTDNVDAQIGDGLPAEAVLGVTRATIDEACSAKVVVLLAPDLKEELPVLYLRLRSAAVDGGLSIIELTPRSTGLTRYVTESLQYRPGEAGAVAHALVAAEDPDINADVAGLGLAELVRARRLLADAGSDVVLVLGRTSVAESAESIAEAANAFVSRGTPVLSALRRSNVHGALDMGLAPGVLPGRVSLEDGRSWFTSAWGAVPKEPGLDTEGIVEVALEGRIHALVLLGSDPRSDFPDRQRAAKALDAVGFTVAVDTFLNESSRQADVVLPAAAFAERAGTFTNLEGRVMRLGRKITPPGVAWADWMIASELAARLGADFGADEIDDLWSEIERVAPAYRGITCELLADIDWRDGVLAPLDRASASSHRLIDPMATPGLASVERTLDNAIPPFDTDVEPEEAQQGSAPPALTFVAPHEGPSPTLDGYSLRLVATRSLYDGGTLVQESKALRNLPPDLTVRVNPYDLDRLGAKTGDQLRLHSPRTSLVVKAVADSGVPRGSAALPFNLPNGGAGDLIDATQPVTDVRIENV
jgi:NADH-quinone oxidoreductase subunit G